MIGPARRPDLPCEPLVSVLIIRNQEPDATALVLSLEPFGFRTYFSDDLSGPDLPFGSVVGAVRDGTDERRYADRAYR
jgi:hypothetical protein